MRIYAHYYGLWFSLFGHLPSPFPFPHATNLSPPPFCHPTSVLPSSPSSPPFASPHLTTFTSRSHPPSRPSPHIYTRSPPLSALLTALLTFPIPASGSRARRHVSPLVFHSTPALNSSSSAETHPNYPRRKTKDDPTILGYLYSIILSPSTNPTHSLHAPGPAEHPAPPLYKSNPKPRITSF